MRIFLSLILAIPYCINAQEAPRFAAIFDDHLVLQQEKPIRVWGFGGSGEEEFEVRLGDERQSIVKSGKGTWEVTFPERPASRKEMTLQLLQGKRIIQEVNHVLIGDVWLAAGQSNMQMQVRSMVKQLPEAAQWADQVDEPTIRFRRVNDPVLQSRDELAIDWQPDQWKPMNRENLERFSAVAAVFAHEIQPAIDVPIGIIDVSWGGKPIEPFIPRDQFETSVRLRKILELSELEKLDELAAIEGGLIIRNPEGYPGAIFNARIGPATRFALKGFLWYQGESNAGKGEDPRHYREKMEALVKGWRSHWDETSLPLYFVQLPSFEKTPGWMRLREEQRLAALSIPQCEMAVTIDLPGEDIHPPHKMEVGRRLAHLALKHSYRLSYPAGGPAPDRIEIEGSKVLINWTHTGTGLAIGNWKKQTPLSERNADGLAHFELAGDDGLWYPATVDPGMGTEELVVRSVKVPAPVAVRYGCETVLSDNLLYNSEGHPASPFCSRLDWLPWEQIE